MQFDLSFDREFSQIANVRDMTPMAYNQFIFFGTGARDNHCPFVGRFDLLSRYGSPLCSFPSDRHYFELLQYMARSVHPVIVYSDMQHLFRHSGVIGRPDQHINLDVIDWIRFRANAYGNLSGTFLNVALMVYYGMVSENSHENTQLGARMKLNGIFELLFGAQDVEFAANCNRGVNAAQIDAECRSRGIFFPGV